MTCPVTIFSMRLFYYYATCFFFYRVARTTSRRSGRRYHGDGCRGASAAPPAVTSEGARCAVCGAHPRVSPPCPAPACCCRPLAVRQRARHLADRFLFYPGDAPIFCFLIVAGRAGLHCCKSIVVLYAVRSTLFALTGCCVRSDARPVRKVTSLSPLFLSSSPLSLSLSLTLCRARPSFARILRLLCSSPDSGNVAISFLLYRWNRWRSPSLRPLLHVA